MHEEERTLWEGGPSHVRDVPFHVLCLLTAWLVVPVLASLQRYLSVVSTFVCEVSGEGLEAPEA